jgi:hypothetical protein
VGVAEAELRCACGQRLYCEVRSVEHHTGSLVFFDNEPTSESYGQQVECCPNCGEKLELPMFFQ